MTPDKLALINLIARVGLSAALTIYETIASAPTAEDAVAALRKAASKSADDYLAEAAAKLAAGAGE